MSKHNSDDDFVMGEIYTPDTQNNYLYEDFCPSDIPFQVYISELALRDIFSHSTRGYKKGVGEIAGALVGNVYRLHNSTHRFIEVNASLPANTRSAHTHVEIPDNEWFRINSLIDKDPRFRLRSTAVGWYHSHPGFGIFLSKTDEDTQKTHFGLDWQIAIVVDPVKVDIGCFVTTNTRQQIPLFLIPRQGDTSVIKAVDFLHNMKSGNLPQADAENPTYQELQKLSEQLRALSDRQSAVLDLISSSIVKKDDVEKNKQSNTAMSTQLENLYKNIDSQLSKTLPAIGELKGKFQNIETAFESLSKDVKSPESTESQRIIHRIKGDLESVKSSQKSLGQILSDVQLKFSQYEKNIYMSQDSMLDKIKGKIEFLQNEQKQTLAIIQSVQKFLTDTQNDVNLAWNGLKRKLYIAAISIVLLAFLGGIAGSYIYQNYLSSETIISTPPPSPSVETNPTMFIPPSPTPLPPSPIATDTVIPIYTP